MEGRLVFVGVGLCVPLLLFRLSLYFGPRTAPRRLSSGSNKETEDRSVPGLMRVPTVRETDPSPDTTSPSTSEVGADIPVDIPTTL